MTRSRVDLPQPDGPMSETNSPRRIVEVDALEGGRDRPVRRGEDLVDARRCGRPDGAPASSPSSRRAARGRPRSATQLQQRGSITKNAMPSSADDEDRRPQLLRAGDVVLVEVDDRAAEAVRDAARSLADDRPDDATRSRRSSSAVNRYGSDAGRRTLR